MTEPDRVAVAVLAGGEGKRIGGRKPQILLGGMTLLDRAYAFAREWSDRCIIVVRSPDQIGPAASPTIADMPKVMGPLAGLAAALGWARDEGVELILTIPCDMPFLPEDLPSRLVATIGENGAALASSNGRLHPVCGLWRTNCLDQLAQYRKTGMSSLRGFAAQVGHVVVDWPSVPRDPFFNINDPDDLEAARKWIAG